MMTHPDSSFRSFPGSNDRLTSSREAGKSRKELILVILLLFVAALFTVYFFMQKNGGRRTIIKEGDRAPEFTLTSSDGRSVSLSDYRGKVVLVHFWATWCPPCVEEMPKIEQLSREFFGNNLEVLAVCVDDEGAEAVSSFMRKNRLTLPVVLNPGGSVARRYGTFKFPETYVLDRSGTVRYKVIGPLDWMAPETTSALRRLVEER